MFVKPYKVKSNNTLKNSEKKHLVQRIVDEFSAATEESAKVLVPLKSSCSCMKLVLHSGEAADVYVTDGVPVLLWARERLLPTVCGLWRVPDLIPSITVQAPVLPKLQNGAPLYLPGVCVPAGGAGFPMFGRGAALAARTSDDAAAAAVGPAALASGEMLLKVGGVCLDVWHCVGDQLCRDTKFAKVERPRLPPAPATPASPASPASPHDRAGDRLAGEVQQLHIQPAVREEWPSLGGRPSAPQVPQMPQMSHVPLTSQTSLASQMSLASQKSQVSQAPASNAPQVLGDEPPAQIEDCLMADESSERSDRGVPTAADELLLWTLLSFIKLHARSIELPIKSSLLYRNYLLPLCPPDRTLDVKKSSYKKVGKFLEAMQKEGLVEVREVEKGVDAVTALHAAHPLVAAHAPPRCPCPSPSPSPAEEAEYAAPLVRELFSVTAAVAELFAPLKKGATLTAAEVRSVLTEYVKTRNLHSAQQKGAVTLDAALARALQASDQVSIKWEALMAGVQARMTPCTEMRFADGTQRLTKAKLEPIKMQVVNRSGNKKVTLVSNLEAFGFVLSELARAWQRGAAAAAGVTRAPGSKHDQILLQGDQTYFVARLLIEKYGLPKKFVDGADKALKKKKGT